MSDAIEVRRAHYRDCRDLFDEMASLHRDLIHGGILPLLGKRFLANLYREIAGTESGFVGIALQGNKLVGFAAGAWDIWKCSCGLSAAGYLRLGLDFLVHLPSPGIFQKAFDAFCYPFRKGEESPENDLSQDKHRAELLAIAVDSTTQGQGAGRLLVRALEDFLKPHVSGYFVTTNIDDPKANAFYRAVGFAEVGRKKHHTLMLQTYFKRLQ